MGYILIWLFFGLFTALIASSRNRSVVGWFFIGFIFGPFGLLFAFFMKDGKELEKELEATLKSSKASIELKDSYYYEIKPSGDADEWQKIKQVLFKHLNGNYKLKRNDAEESFFEVTEEIYIKLFIALKDHKKVFAITSMNFGSIDFGKDFDVITSEQTNQSKEQTLTNYDETDKLIKLSEMLDKGLITEEEFKTQKENLLK